MNRSLTIIIIAVLLTVALFGMKGCIENANDYISVRRSLDKIKIDLQDSITYYKSKVGVVASVPVTKIAHSNRDLLKDKVNGTGIKYKTIESITTITTNVHDTIVTFIHDTIIQEKKASLFNYSDKWIIFKGRIINDNLKAIYSIRDSISLITHWDKIGMFKPKELTVSVISHNPNSMVTGLKEIIVEAPRKKFYQRQETALILGLIGGFVLSHTILR